LAVVELGSIIPMSATGQDTHEILRHRAEMSMAEGDIANAFALYMRAVNAAPHIHLYKERFLELASRGLDIAHSDELEAAVAACLETPDLAGAVENWASLLVANPGFQAAYGLGGRRAFDPARKPAAVTTIEPLLRPLFLQGMKSNVVCNPVFEEFVADVRRHLLDAFSKNGGFSDDYVTVASALSHYASFADFILEETKAEQNRIDDLRREIETGMTRSAAAIVLLACYRPLCSLANAGDLLDAFKNNEIVSEVVQAQIADPIVLRQIADSIPALSPVSDPTSLNVRGQYEAFPYPCWRALSKRHIVENWQAEELGRRLEAPLLSPAASILIAGCGTGRDAAIHSLRFPASSITAVDVSRTSLAYAAMKAKELGLANLTFAHGDILDLGRLGQTFDHICCTGVLHHMEDPVAGWRVLRDLLKPGGLMRIGLYSRAGRTAVAAAQQAARRGGYLSTREDILRFRRDFPRLCNRETLLRLSQLQDYYHLNMYRDLLFPAREHRFDLGQIGDMLDELNLLFEGFYVSADVLTRYRSMFRDDRYATHLKSWMQFESRHPDTFASMYIFWCRKPRQ
jgi:SAM-dependent methyltransferase